MGSGNFAVAGFGKAAFQSDLYFIDQATIAQPVSGENYVTNPSCYSLEGAQLPRPKDSTGRYFYFGGPGNADPGCGS
jgi:hypothetical protein